MNFSPKCENCKKTDLEKLTCGILYYQPEQAECLNAFKAGSRHIKAK